METTIWLVVCIACAIIFAALAFWAYRSKEPVHFIGGTKVEAEEIKNIKAFNMANASMWVGCCILYIIITIVGLIKLGAGLVIMILSCMPGMPLIIVLYRMIYKKYKV